MEKVYILECGGFYKIGFTGQKKVQDRVDSMKTGNPLPINILKVYECIEGEGFRREKILHYIFNNKRHKGEWFMLLEDDFNIIDEFMCTDINDRKFINEIKQLEDKKKTYFKFKYIKHHIYMNIDIYEIIGKDLYGHFKRLIDTMNENNVCDLDKLDLKKSAKYTVKDKLIKYGLIKEIKLEKNINKKLYINPAFGLNSRIFVNEELEKEFREINKELYKLDLKNYNK